MAVALGFVSVLAYGKVQGILKTKEATQRELLYTHYNTNCRRERARLDRLLLLQARTLASQAQFQLSRTRNLYLAPLNLLSTGLDPNSSLLAPIWLAGRSRNSWIDYFRGSLLTKIQVNEELLPRLGDAQINEY